MQIYFISPISFFILLLYSCNNSIFIGGFHFEIFLLLFLLVFAALFFPKFIHIRLALLIFTFYCWVIIFAMMCLCTPLLNMNCFLLPEKSCNHFFLLLMQAGLSFLAHGLTVYKKQDKL